MKYNYMIFIDFDGTITANDVGYEMFKKFTRGATEPLVQSYRRGEVNSLNCLSGECELWNIESPKVEDVREYLDSQNLRPGLGDFLKKLKEWDIKPLILSEGFDFYIDRILETHGLSDLERITNLARFEDGKLYPEFPYQKLGCGECSNCKGYHIRRLNPPISCAIYIGDGHSDYHASQAADIIFARSHLEDLLTNIKRKYYSYENFDNIRNKLEVIIKTGLFTESDRINFCRLSDRHRRQIRELWESGEVMRLVGYPDGLGWSEAEFNSFWPKMLNDDKSIRLALEDKSGGFLGEAMIAFPADNNLCEPDLKLLPEFWGRGLAFEAWQIILDRIGARWPEAGILVTPNIENHRALNLYRKLGFEFDGGEQTWQPPQNLVTPVPVRYRRMIKKDIAINRPS